MTPLSRSALRYPISAVLALVALASPLSWEADAAGPQTLLLFCGVVAANQVTTGEGSGPGTYVLQVTSGPAGAAGQSFIFGVAPSIALPTIGTYICGQFAQGAPMAALMVLVRPSDPGYVASTLPSTTTEPQTSITPASIGLVLIGLGILAAIGLVNARVRRSSPAN